MVADREVGQRECPGAAEECTGAMPGGATVQAGDIHHVWNVFFLAAIGVAAVVYALIFWALVRFRRRDDRPPPHYSGHTAVELSCTAMAVLIVAGLFVVSYVAETRIKRLNPRP